MNSDSPSALLQLATFAATLEAQIRRSPWLARPPGSIPTGLPADEILRADDTFNAAALRLFSLQFEANAVYRRLCMGKGILSGHDVRCWQHIPAVPTAAFKELSMTSLPLEDQVASFHSSGTTGQARSRHQHSAASLHLYECSLLSWFEHNVLGAPGSAPAFDCDQGPWSFLALTPPAVALPHSSLVHMFEAVGRCSIGGGMGAAAGGTRFCGTVAADGGWELDTNQTVAALAGLQRQRQPAVVLGTAFNFVHLLDCLTERGLRFALPPGSVVLETGGYKGRSRVLARTELAAALSHQLGVRVLASSPNTG